MVEKAAKVEVPVSLSPEQHVVRPAEPSATDAKIVALHQIIEDSPSRDGSAPERVVYVGPETITQAEKHEITASLENIDNLVEALPKLADESIRGLEEIVNKWGNEELSLMYQEYLLAKKITGPMFAVTDTLDIGVNMGELASKAVDISAGVDESIRDMADKIEWQVNAVALAYRIPASLGKIAILIYKKIILNKLEKLAEENPSKIKNVDEFKAWLKDEKKEVSTAAKKTLIKFGMSLPEHLLTAISLCRFNAPILHLGLVWVDAVLGPLSACYDLHKATNAAIAIEKDISGFRNEMFRHVREEGEAIRNKRREAFLARRQEFEEPFNQLLRTVMEQEKFFDYRRMLEKEGVRFDPRIKTKEAFHERLANDETFKDNLLVSYIESKSNQPLADSARNALKTLTIKKQGLQKGKVMAKLTKAKVLLAATAIACIATVILTTLSFTGVVAVPMLVLFLPTAGLLSVSFAFLALSAYKFYKHKPNLFREYVSGSLVKLAVYDIPKSCQEIRKTLKNMKMLKVSMAVKDMEALLLKLDDGDPEKENVRLRLEELKRDSLKVANQIQALDEKIQYWNEKINSIKVGVAQARWKDFIQELPTSLPQSKSSQETEEVMAIIQALKEGFISGNAVFDDDTRKLIETRLGLDPDVIKETKLEKALLAFAP